MTSFDPNEKGYWGEFGGRFVPETLVSPLDELTEAYYSTRDDFGFQSEFQIPVEGLRRAAFTAVSRSAA